MGAPTKMSAMVPADRALLEQLGARIREIRESKKLTQDEIAERAGFGGKYIGEVEKGLRDVPVSTLRAVAENGLGIRIEALFDGRRSTRRSRTLAPPTRCGDRRRDTVQVANERAPAASRPDQGDVEMSATGGRLPR
jgi:transcriptional regulator with XRE-family HTH domain